MDYYFSALDHYFSSKCMTHKTEYFPTFLFFLNPFQLPCLFYKYSSSSTFLQTIHLHFPFVVIFDPNVFQQLSLNYCQVNFFLLVYFYYYQIVRKFRVYQCFVSFVKLISSNDPFFRLYHFNVVPKYLRKTEENASLACSCVLWFLQQYYLLNFYYLSLSQCFHYSLSVSVFQLLAFLDHGAIPSIEFYQKWYFCCPA